MFLREFCVLSRTDECFMRSKSGMVRDGSQSDGYCKEAPIVSFDCSEVRGGVCVCICVCECVHVCVCMCVCL